MKHLWNCTWLLCSGSLGCAAMESLPPSPFVANLPLKEADLADATTFTAADRIVGTYYFYWYNVYTQEHFVNGDRSDALTDHPVSNEDYSYTSAAWHRRELEDVHAAGIDFIAPVYWGAPSEYDAQAGLHWSFAGLPPLVEAADAMAAEGQKPPKIGLFYDTSTLQHNRAGYHADLTTDFGRAWFYATIRDFFALIPPRHWAMIDGRPVVFLYAAGFAAKHDQSCIDYVKEQFRKDFAGREPYLVREASWNVPADNVYAWGGAVAGCLAYGVTAVGPGYDHTAVPGRQPLIVKREEGTFYERNWQKALACPSRIVMVETWNEWHEGTDVAHSREYGRQYLDLTAKYARMFHEGRRPTPPGGKFAEARRISVELSEKNQEEGLVQVEAADGVTAPVEIGGRTGRKSVPTEHGGRYVYFQVDDGFLFATEADVTVEIEYFDRGAGRFHLEYDGANPQAFLGGAYTAGPTVALTGSETWKTATVTLANVWFANRQNAQSDFRLTVDGPDVYVRRVTVRR